METVATAVPTMRRATVADVYRVLALVREAAQWLKDRGISQWQSYHTDEGKNKVLSRITGESGAEVYIASRRGHDIGTLTLQWEDTAFWDQRGADGLAGYIHMLAVVKTAHGQGVGSIMLQWAEQTIVAKGRRLARLDCGAANSKLIHYYQKLGYVQAGMFHGPILTQLLEKPLG